MKKKRHDKILEIINNHEIDTQGELAQLLRGSGFNVTQATVSRDIRELGLVKVTASGGKQKYQAAKPVNEQKNRLIRVLKDSVQSVDQAQNILVIKTGSGMAMAAAAAIDNLTITGILGCIAGDDTIMAVLQSPEAAEQACEKLRQDLQD